MKQINAIIMAAGMSSRLAPLSYEKPKGLLKVKNEILIERQIKQLQEKGIVDITVITGYKAEQFEYLRDQFGVDIVYNKDYFRYNNTSSLRLVIDKLKNTYICPPTTIFKIIYLVQMSQNLFTLFKMQMELVMNVLLL